jgi:hypothetical protein
VARGDAPAWRSCGSSLTAVTGSGALLVYVALAAWRAQDMREVLGRAAPTT